MTSDEGRHPEAAADDLPERGAADRDLPDGIDSDEEVALVDLVNRVIDRGVMISGEVLISVAGVELVQLGLNLYLASSETLEQRGGRRWLDERTDERLDERTDG